MNLRRKKSAFTLVELLVVIGIIAILISILLPTLSKAREQALIVACSAQMRDIGNALNMYGQYNKQYFPGPCWGQIRSGYYSGSSLLMEYLSRYLRLPDPSTGTAIKPVLCRMTQCPGYLAKNSGANIDSQFWTYTVLEYDPYPWFGYPGAAATYFPYYSKINPAPPGPYVNQSLPLKITQVWDAPEMPIIGDLDNGEVMYELGAIVTGVSEYPNHGGKAERAQGVQEQENTPFYQLLPVHAATNPPRNCLFADGHVSTIRHSGPVLPGNFAAHYPPEPGAVPLYTN